MNALSSTQRRDGGFSLVEILAVFVLIAILSGIAAPSMNNFLAQQRTRRALDRVAADIAFARIYAVQHRRPTVVRLLSDSVYTVDWINGVDTVQLKRVNLRQDYPGVAVSGNIPRLQFNTRGLLENYQGQVASRRIRSLSAAARDSLVVSPVGRVYRGY